MRTKTVIKTTETEIQVLELGETEQAERKTPEYRELLERLYTARSVGNREEQDRLIGLLIWEELGRVG